MLNYTNIDGVEIPKPDVGASLFIRSLFQKRLTQMQSQPLSIEKEESLV